MGALIPSIEGPVLYSIFGADVKAGALGLGIALTALLTFLHLRGTDLATRVQDAMTIILLVSCVGFIGAGLIGGDTENMSPTIVFNDDGWKWAGLVSVFAVTPLFFGGFNFAIQAVGERAPGVTIRAVGIALTASIIAGGLFYIMVIISASMASPREALLAADIPAAAAFEAAFNSPILSKVVLFAGLMGLLTSWNSVIFACARIIFVLAQHNHLPKIFARPHQQYGTPYTAVLFIGALTTVGAFGGTAAIGPIIGSASMTIATAYLIVVLAANRLQKDDTVQNTRMLIFSAMSAAIFIVVVSFFEPFFSRPELHAPTPWIFLLLWLTVGAAIWMRLKHE